MRFGEMKGFNDYDCPYRNDHLEMEALQDVRGIMDEMGVKEPRCHFSCPTRGRSGNEDWK